MLQASDAAVVLGQALLRASRLWPHPQGLPLGTLRGSRLEQALAVSVVERCKAGILSPAVRFEAVGSVLVGEMKQVVLARIGADHLVPFVLWRQAQHGEY